MGTMEIKMLTKGVDHPSLKLFKKEKLLGKGGFGEVWKVIFLKKNYPFALKEISKENIVKNKMIESIFLERDILFSIYNEHIVNLYATFQDNNKLYMIMDYLEGRDLRNQMRIELFNENQIKFLAGCIIIGLDYIHSKGIIHRDIKPENLIFDSKGYLRITDFGIAIRENKKNKNNNNDKSGTACYMAPERLAIDNNITYGYSSDFFSLGVILYELVTLQKPFKAFDGKIENYIRPYKSLVEDIYNDKIILEPDIANKLRENRIKYLKENKRDKFKYGLSNIKLSVNQNYNDMCDFINKLLTLEEDKRLGFNNINEVKNHSWFTRESFSWKKLYHRTLILNFKINCFIKENNENKNQNENNKERIDNEKEIKAEIDKNQNIYKDKFNNFTLIHKVTSKEIDFLYMEGTYGKDNYINSHKRACSANNKTNIIINYKNKNLLAHSKKSIKIKKDINHLLIEKENSFAEMKNKTKIVSSKDRLLLHKSFDKNISRNLKLPPLMAKKLIIQENNLKVSNENNIGLCPQKKKRVSILNLKMYENLRYKNFDNPRFKINFLNTDRNNSFRGIKFKIRGQKSRDNLYLINDKKYKIFLNK